MAYPSLLPPMPGHTLMSKVELQRDPMHKGNSKIPRALPIRYSDMENANYMRKPSRLLQLKEDFQRKLMQEKEEKLIHIYEENKNRALQRVGNYRDYSGKGHVRDFFHERRKLEQHGTGHVPDINRHYQNTRNDFHSQSSFHTRQGSRGSNRSATSSTYSKGSSAGIDRANPLAPIETMNTTNQSKKKAVLQKSNRKDGYAPNDASKKAPRPNALQVPQADYATSSAGSTPPPNLAKLRQIQQDRLQTKGSPTKPVANEPSKQTDFQKWQADQEQARLERLKKYNTKRAVNQAEDVMYDEDRVEQDDEDEVARKQQELLDTLAQREQELEMLRIEREREEEEGRREMERRKEEAERRRREEEEQRLRDEEKRRRYEEEEMRREEEMREKRISAQNSPAKRNVNRRGIETHANGFDHEPSPPPPKFKPKMVRRRTTSKHSAPSPTGTEDETTYQSSANVDIYRAAALSEDARASDNIALISCPNCGRGFAEDRLAKHKKICTGLKKRKQFNSQKARAEGTDLAQYRPPPRSEPKVKKSNWRQKREDFINALRYAKAVTKAEADGVNPASLPPPPRTENPDYVPCPHCNRTFNSDAAERHIPRCQNIKTKPAPNRRR